MIWHQSLPSYIGMHSWQIKCVVLSVTVSVVDVEPVQQAAPPCFSSKHTTHCPESRSCLKHELQVGRHWEDLGVACGGSRILLAAILKSNHIYIMNCDQLSVKKNYKYFKYSILFTSICIVRLHHFQEVEGSLNCETSAITTKLPFSVSCRSALFFGFCSS